MQTKQRQASGFRKLVLCRTPHHTTGKRNPNQLKVRRLQGMTESRTAHKHKDRTEQGVQQSQSVAKSLARSAAYDLKNSSLRPANARLPLDTSRGSEVCGVAMRVTRDQCCCSADTCPVDRCSSFVRSITHCGNGGAPWGILPCVIAQ